MTVQKIYDEALALMNMTIDDADYAESVITGMLNVMMREQRDVSNSISRKWHRPPVLELPVLHTFADDVPLEEDVCRSVLPYGLAAKLMMEDDMAIASYLNQEYRERSIQYSKPFVHLMKEYY